MMKKILLLISIFLSITAFSQSTVTDQNQAIVEDVDQLAEFPGGINAFRNELTKNFDSSKLKGKGVFKTEISFVIDLNGEITEVSAKGTNTTLNNESIKAIKKIKKKWKPATIDNIPVKYRFRLPLTMDIS